MKKENINKKINFKLEEAISILNLQTEERIEQSRERLINYISSSCGICDKDNIIKDKDVNYFLIKRVSYFQIKILD